MVEKRWNGLGFFSRSRTRQAQGRRKRKPSRGSFHRVDCDKDCVLIRVNQVGGAARHAENRFFSPGDRRQSAQCDR
ncbi:MAG: hypothetical protein IPN19_04900 [Elusimicrobia bacterium]|nr:hypothetical protein [Elusimicrobiota bacterium]